MLSVCCRWLELPRLPSDLENQAANLKSSMYVNPHPKQVSTYPIAINLLPQMKENGYQITAVEVINQGRLQRHHVTT